MIVAIISYSLRHASPRNIGELDDFYSLAREAGVHACF
ncbi:hypothetical protein Mpsy_1463 [Methanolobus psychrophilus R15]|nr:hypothetical protein Mpsy_1463 [Methanolobus psychrophilus R15]